MVKVSQDLAGNHLQSQADIAAAQELAAEASLLLARIEYLQSQDEVLIATGRMRD
jgi:hypothetical protein